MQIGNPPPAPSSASHVQTPATPQQQAFSRQSPDYLAPRSFRYNHKRAASDISTLVNRPPKSVESRSNYRRTNSLESDRPVDLRFQRSLRSPSPVVTPPPFRRASPETTSHLHKPKPVLYNEADAAQHLSVLQAAKENLEVSIHLNARRLPEMQLRSMNQVRNDIQSLMKEIENARSPSSDTSKLKRTTYELSYRAKSHLIEIDKTPRSKPTGKVSSLPPRTDQCFRSIPQAEDDFPSLQSRRL